MQFLPDALEKWNDGTDRWPRPHLFTYSESTRIGNISKTVMWGAGIALFWLYRLPWIVNSLQLLKSNSYETSILLYSEAAVVLSIQQVYSRLSIALYTSRSLLLRKRPASLFLDFSKSISRLPIVSDNRRSLGSLASLQFSYIHRIWLLTDHCSCTDLHCTFRIAF